jgi:hypothetical protein
MSNSPDVDIMTWKQARRVRIYNKAYGLFTFFFFSSLKLKISFSNTVYKCGWVRHLFGERFIWERVKIITLIGNLYHLHFYHMPCVPVFKHHLFFTITMLVRQTTDISLMPFWYFSAFYGFLKTRLSILINFLLCIIFHMTKHLQAQSSKSSFWINYIMIIKILMSVLVRCML